MGQDNSARDNFDRRRFLGALLGLGTGAAALGATRPSPSTNVESTSEYERRLTSTEYTRVLGHPRDCSVVREGLDPFHPQRTVVFHSGGDLRIRINRKIEKLRDRMPYGTHPLSFDKLNSISMIMRRMTAYYRVPELFEDWVLGLVRRESLATSATGNHFGLVHQFQRSGKIQVDCPPIDWWLFLFPGGIDWASIDGKPVHALIGHVSQFPQSAGAFLRAWCLTATLAHTVEDWRLISLLRPLDGAAHLNEVTVRLLEKSTE
jgi:hypothetical protein